MMYVRGHTWDYDHWAELGAHGWAFKDVIPYFKRMETNSAGADSYRGGSGPVHVSGSRIHYPIVDEWIEAAAATGIERTSDHNGARPAEGTGYAQVTQKMGLRSPSTSYLKLPGAKENLTVELEAQALKVLIENGRAVGVEYRHEGQVKRATARRGVVVSSGALNTPRLLMLSGIGPAAHLKEHGIPVVADLPGVGRNLQEHFGTHLVNEVSTPTLNSEARGLHLIRHMADFVLRRRGILTTSVGHAQAFLRTRPNLPAPNIQISFTCFAFDLDKEGKLVLRKDDAVSTVVCIARPQSRGTVTLRSADPMVAPVITHRLLDVEDDVEQVCEGIEIARQIMDQPQIKKYVTAEARPGKDVHGEALKAYCHLACIPLYHPVGTCKIGDGPDAVVDSELRVRGVDGLWLADASVMPTLPIGNTNATAIMIGDKGSDHVLKALRNAPMLAPAA